MIDGKTAAAAGWGAGGPSRLARADEPALPDVSGSYDRYISSGLYDRRYPGPNRRSLRIMKRHLPAGGRFVDVGAGTGRYALPLLHVAGTTGVAHDICPVARKRLAERLGEFVAEGRLTVHGGEADALAADRPRAFDLGLLAFGVLAHVAGRAERLRLLRAMRSMLKEDGTLFLSVPNARRRFRREQAMAAPLIRAGKLEAGDILYRRRHEDGEIELFYHLYTPAEVTRDLREAGFGVASIGAESLLSERAVVSNPVTGWLDAAACGPAPASLGYDLLAVAKPLIESARTRTPNSAGSQPPRT